MNGPQVERFFEVPNLNVIWGLVAAIRYDYEDSKPKVHSPMKDISHKLPLTLFSKYQATSIRERGRDSERHQTMRDTERDRKIDRKIDRETHRETYRETHRVTHRETHKETHRETHRDIYIVFSFVRNPPILYFVFNLIKNLA